MVEASDVGDFSSHKMRRIEKSFPDSRGDEKLTKPSCAIASSSSKLDEAARSPNVEKIFSDTTSIASSVASLLPSLTTEQEDSSASKPANSDGDASAAKKQFGCDVSEDCPRIESSSVKLDAVGTKHESERIAVGTRVEVHTYPSNSDEEPRWYGAEVISLELVMGDPFKVEFDVSYDEDPSFIDTIVWPTDAGDIRVLPSLAGRQKKRRRKKPAGSSSSASLPAEFIRDLSPSFDEVSNMLQFFTCQLRAEYAEIVACSSAALLKEERCGPSRRAAYEEFDAEMRRYCEGEGFEWRDVASCAPFMAKFLLGKCARGDKWVPWHAALGSHERYILEVVTRLPLLRTERERHVLCYVFSGSREIKLFESLLRPLYEENALEEDRALGRQILDDPSTAFARDGELHRRFAQYRKLGERLHTTAYLCHPPRGASGDEFVYYVVDRTRRFVEIGQAAFDCIEKNRGVLDSNDLRSEVEKLLMGFREIGPTMTKMFTVTTHLSYPDLGLLDSRCTVGDGADRAFDFLYPEVKKSATTRSNLDRSRLLENLFEHLRDRCDDPTLLTRRFRHMLEWVSQRARERFSSFHPDSLLSSVTHYDLQVNLCEWRKFRCSVDATGLLKSGSVLSPDIDPSDSIHSGTKKRKQKQHASPQQQMFVI